jgi:hypothetical protein
MFAIAMTANKLIQSDHIGKRKLANTGFIIAEINCQYHT